MIIKVQLNMYKTNYNLIFLEYALLRKQTFGNNQPIKIYWESCVLQKLWLNNL